MRPPGGHSLNELRTFFVDFVNDCELDRLAFRLQLVSQARLTFSLQFRPKFVAPFQYKPTRRLDFDYLAAVGKQIAWCFHAPRSAKFPFRFLSRVSPVLPSEFRLDECLPQFLRRCANVGYVNELLFLHRITLLWLSWFWFVRDLFSDRSTPEDDGFRICQSNARRSHATALD